MPSNEQWKVWRQKRAWYERNASRKRRRALDAHAAEGGFYVRHPLEGELLDGLDQGRVSVGEGTPVRAGVLGHHGFRRLRSGSARVAFSTSG